MNNKIYNLICLFAIIFYNQMALSQTTTINYLTSTLNTSDCNVFGPASINVGSVPHLSFAGGVTFSSAKGILLGTSASNPIGGTAYVIDYSFSPGYNYDIAITATGNQATYLKTSVVFNLNSFLTTAAPYACALDPNVPLWSTTGYGQLSAQTSTSSAIYAIPQFSIPGNTIYPNLVIWVGGGQSNLSLDVLSISKIVITKTQQTQPVTFTLPSSINISCGSAIPQTFTVTNVNNTPGITGYSWNLGSANNGWLYNGTSAPQIISTGASNTLTLTPVCGGFQNNLNATVTVNSNNYTTNVSVVTSTLPTFSINGVNVICSTIPENFIVNNLPCNASVSWLLSPATGIVSKIVSGNSVALSKTGNGTVTLTATVTACGIITAISKTINVGYISPAYLNYTSDDYSCYELGLKTAIVPNASYYWWAYKEENGTTSDFVNATTTSNMVKLPLTEMPGAYRIGVTITNACGEGFPLTRQINVECSGMFTYTVSPNPATHIITVQENQNYPKPVKSETVISINGIKVFDNLGNLKKQSNYGAGVHQAQLNIADLINGIYFIEITNGKKKERHQLIIQK